MRRYHLCTTALVMLLAVATAACTKTDEAAAGGNSAAMDSAQTKGSMSAVGHNSGMAGMADMKGMDGTNGMKDSIMGGVSSEMHAHMQSMMSASGERMKGLLPMHRQMVANMIANMNGEMRDMKMASDTQWSATVDSLRKDLVRLPVMSNAELTAMMPAHVARVRHLGEMHHQMMRSMSAK